MAVMNNSQNPRNNRKKMNCRKPADRRPYMEQETKFYAGNDQKSILKLIRGSDIPQGLQELCAEMKEGAGEKHLPVAELEQNKVVVKVGSVFHPMLEEHSIEWVYLKTEKCEQLMYLKPGGDPVAEFALLPGDKPVCVYAYCNLHGLWKLPLHG